MPTPPPGGPTTDGKLRRRRLLHLGIGGLVFGTAGCTRGDRTPSSTVPREDADVIVGPNQGLRFEPDRITTAPGETVTWYFASETHNVSGVPVHHSRVTLPEGADPFASYPGDDSLETRQRGAVYRHTLAVPGRYVYVCVPHAELGMTGEIVVEE